MSQPYTLFIANKNYSSWSLRPWLLLRQLGIPFTEQLVPFDPDDAQAVFRSFSPSGQVPCLQTGDITVWDSLAITEFLAEHHPEVWPSDAATRAWARSATAEMHSGFGTLRDICSMDIGFRIRLHALTPALQADLNRLEALWNEGLTRFGGPWLCGSDFCAADAFYAPIAFRAQTYGLSFGEPATAYLARLLALPEMQAWQQAALGEPWREPGHERDALAHGNLLEDLRA